MIHDDERARLDHEINRVAKTLITAKATHMADVAFSNTVAGLPKIAGRMLERLVEINRTLRVVEAERDHWRQQCIGSGDIPHTNHRV